MPEPGNSVKGDRSYNEGMAKIPDVLVLGGGIIGLTSAYYLAKAGLRVEVIDRGEMGREASWAGAGILPPAGRSAGNPIDALRRDTVRAFPVLTTLLKMRTGIENGWTVCGGIEVEDGETAHARAVWDADGIRYRKIGPERLAEMEPNLRTHGRTSYHFPGFAQVRNPRHLRALVAACPLGGIALTPRCHLTEWEIGGGRVAGIRDASGTLRVADHYLIACGAWAEALLRPLGCPLGIHPVRGQIALYRPAEPLLTRVILDGKRYLVPRGDGRILVGSTEEPEAGFVKATTPEGEADLRNFAESWVPALARATLETSWAGLRPTSRDGLPSIGRVPGQDRVFAAVGHGRAGIQLSIGTARLIVDMIAGKTPPAYADAFRLDRPPTANVRPAFRS